MKELTPAIIEAATGGSFYGPEEKRHMPIREVVTDSRQAVPGCVFVAIKGERSDGHAYIAQVMEKGACLVLISDATKKEEAPCILVEDTEEAIRDLARYYMTTISPKVISVTGSVGKTSTKEMIASVVAQSFQMKKTMGNLNNELGLPFTVFTLEKDTEVAVLEMGISQFGEMDLLGGIAPPDIAVITNIGECHLEFLRDRDGVFAEKTAIFHHLKEGGVAILNGDDDKLCRVTEAGGRPPIFYGFDPSFDVYADEIEEEGLGGVRARIHLSGTSFDVQIPYPGRHMVQNALCAAAVGMVLGMRHEDICRGIEEASLPGGRLHMITTDRGVTIIDDCYNANPVSMKASLGVLAAAPGRKIAVLGNMAELGDTAVDLHRDVGKVASTLAIDEIVLVGDLMQEASDAFRTKEGCAARCYATTDEAAKDIPAMICPGDTVLVKASHSMGFDRIVSSIAEMRD